MKNNKFIKYFSWLVLAFLFIPLLIIVVTSFGTNNIIEFPISGFTLDWFKQVFASQSFMSALWLSVKLALASTLLALLIGVPASYALVKRKSKLSDFLLSYFLSPSIIPGIVVGFALFRVLVLTMKIPLFVALLSGHFLVVLPYIIRIVAAGLSDFDMDIEEAAVSLGCTRVQAFFKAVLPNITSSLVSAFMLGFINSFNNIPISMFLKGPGMNTLPYALISYIEYNYNPAVSALSTVIMIATLVLMLVVEKTMGLSTGTSKGVSQ